MCRGRMREAPSHYATGQRSDPRSTRRRKTDEDPRTGWRRLPWLADRTTPIRAKPRRRVVDNFARRLYDSEMGVDSLVPIRQLQRRVTTWKEVSGHTVQPFIGDLTDDVFVEQTIHEFAPRQLSTSPSSDPLLTR